MYILMIKVLNLIFVRDIELSEFHIEAVNNQQPDENAVIHLLAKIDKYSQLKVDGKVRPFAATPKHDFTVLLNEMSLPSISPYIKEPLHHEIKSGQLDVNLAAKVIGEELDGKLKIKLRGIELTAADDAEVDSIKDKTSMPLNLALGTLKDSDDNVKIITSAFR